MCPFVSTLGLSVDVPFCHHPRAVCCCAALSLMCLLACLFCVCPRLSLVVYAELPTLTLLAVIDYTRLDCITFLRSR